MAHRSPQRHIANRKNIGVAAAEHQIDFRRPRTNAAKRHQLRKGHICFLATDGIKIDAAIRNRLRQPFQRCCLGPGKAESGAQFFRHRQIVFRRHRPARAGKDTDPYGVGAGARHHLRHDDMGKARKAGLVNTQLQRTGFFDNKAKSRIEAGKMRQTFADIVEAPDDFHVYTAHIHVGPAPGGEALQNMAEEIMPSPVRQKPVYRFAPSPNGALHLGHALSAFLNHDMVRENSGHFLLRIEDIDQTRCTPELEQAIYDDLGWLGLEWEKPVRRQSEHFDEYRTALDRLVEADLAYPAFLSRGETKAIVRAFEAEGRLWPRDPDGAPLYPAIDRQRPQAERAELLASGRQHAWRLDMEKAVRTLHSKLFWRESGDGQTGEIEALPALWGDVVLSRSDAPSSYHLSVVVDDALQGITHVVRGMDLFNATAIHRLLQQLLDLPPPAYHHHRLILGADGRKLSKSEGSTGLSALRAEGKTPSDIRRLVGLL